MHLFLSSRFLHSLSFRLCYPVVVIESFLGMQLSVDARDINKEPVTGQEAIQLVSADTTVSVSTLKTDTARAQSPERVPADSEKSRFMPGVFPTPLATIEASENPLTAAGRQLASF